LSRLNPAASTLAHDGSAHPIGDTMKNNLSTEQNKLLQSALEQHRSSLAGQLAEHLHGQSRTERARDVLEQDGDDAPQRAPEREVAHALTTHEQVELAAVDAALVRLASGHYGRCRDCEAAIPFARLQAEPWAQRCVACETLHERSRA
jgi:DnaK suppressor protein